MLRPTSSRVFGAAVALFAACAHPKVQQAPQTATTSPPAGAQHQRFEVLAPVEAPPLRFAISPTQLTSECAALENACDARLAAVVAVPPSERHFSNTFLAFERAIADYEDASSRLAFLKNIHPDEKVRAAGAACEERSGKYLVRVNARKDLYLALRGYADGAGKTEPLEPVDRRLMFIVSREFRRNGLELSDADREKLTLDRSRLAELASKFEANLDEDRSAIEVTASQLKGLPADFVARLKKSPSGKLLVTTQYPDYYPLMQNARDPDVRHRMEVAFESRAAAANEKLLSEALVLRQDVARLLGFANFADYVTENRMAKNSKTVEAFLVRLRGELLPGRDRLNQRMEAMKARTEHMHPAPLTSWDWRFYLNELRKKDFALDSERVRAYFPSETVFKGLFQVYASLLDVTFREVPNPAVWAKGVRLYEVHDAPTGRLLATFYIDPFPREGKYGHAACFPLGLARELPTGYLVPMSVLVTNFDPAHFSVQEVETLFHEFGHVMHASLTTVPYATLAGSNVALDFVEAPSQMLENWVYQPEVLKLISVDPQAPGIPMPEAVAKKLALARTFDSGVRYTRQDFLASLDNHLHTHPLPPDLDGMEKQMREDFQGYRGDPKEHPLASFGHLMSGYEGGYYGYLWSEVFAEDMFTRFEKEGVLNAKTGRAYRDIILANGQTEEPEVLLERFLGRPPDEGAFLRLMGIQGN